MKFRAEQWLCRQALIPVGERWIKGKKHDMARTAYLCRCGESSNLLFCDAAHMKYEYMKIKRK